MRLVPVIVSLALTACSSLPGVYRIDVQQGNVLTQEQVNQLEYGMNRNQVKFVMGTPILIDTFHPERWDYYYSLKPGSSNLEPAEYRLTLTFEEDRLTGINGDFQPQPPDQIEPKEKNQVVVVPPGEPEDVGIVNKFLRLIGVRGTDS